MTEENMKIYDSVRRPPETALRQIKGGRLSGMTDINPQWRIESLTKLFGPCGMGWYYKRTNYWKENGADGEVFVFVDIELFVKATEVEWSKPIPGSGGSALIAKEKAGLRGSDEAIKMATTDALSVACKALGIGADIYAGRWDGSKYKDAPVEKKQTPPAKIGPPTKTVEEYIADVDKLSNADAVLEWKDKVRSEVEKNLNKQDLTKLASYCSQVVDVFNTGGEND